MNRLPCAKCGKINEISEKTCTKCGFAIRNLYSDEKNHIEEIEDITIKNYYSKLDASISKYKMGKEYPSIKICGGDVFLAKEEKGFEQYLKIKNKGANLYRSVVNEKEDLITSTKYLDVLVNKWKKIWDEMTLELVKRVVKEAPLLVSDSPESIRGITLSFLFDNGFESQYEDLISLIAQAINQSNTNLKLANEYRALRKDSRGRFGFIAGSPKGIAKGFVKSAALNATTGALHSGFNMMGSLKDQWKIASKKNKLYSQMMKERIIQDVLERDLKVIEKYLWDYMRAAAESNNYQEIVSEWKAKSECFLKLYPFLGDLEDKRKCLLKGLQYNPYSKCLYYYLLRDFYEEYLANKNEIDCFAEGLDISLPIMEKKVNDARTFEGVQYKSFEEYLDAAPRTFRGVVYNTVQERENAEFEYSQKCTYNGKRYSSPKEAEEAKNKAEEREKVDEIVSDEITIRMDRKKLLETISKLEKMNPKYDYGKEMLRNLKNRFQEIDYEGTMSDFKVLLESITQITSKDKSKCLNLIDKAERYATEEEKEVIQQIVKDETEKKIKQLDKKFDENKKKYAELIAQFDIESKRIRPQIWIKDTFDNNLSIFMWMSLLCFLLSSIYCLVHFFQTLGTGYTLADGMFFGYIGIAILWIYIIMQVDPDDLGEVIENLEFDYGYNNYKKLYNLKFDIRSMEKTIQESTSQYGCYYAIMNKAGCTVNKKKPPTKFSESKVFPFVFEKIDKASKRYKWVHVAICVVFTVSIWLTLLLVILHFSPAKEQKANTNSAPVVTQTSSQEESPKLSKKKITLKVGQTHKLKLSNKKGKIKWSSNNKKVATVSASGKVTAKKRGQAKIKAKSGKKEYICKVTVK